MQGNKVGTVNNGAINFRGFSKLIGGTARDTFELGTNAASMLVYGGAGDNYLLGSNADTTWNITGVGAGQVNNVGFSGIQNIRGGLKNDKFQLASGAGLPGYLHGGLGENTLSYANWSSGVTVNAGVAPTSGVAANSATGVGKLLGNTFTIIVGGAGNDRLFANQSKPSILIGGAGNENPV